MGNAIKGKKGFQNKPLLERFDSYVNKAEACWLWTGSTDGRYGVIWVTRGIRRKAPRVAWNLFRGDIPDGQFFCHKCDNPLCVNPDHLFLGTQRENLVDALKKSRFANQVIGPTEHQMAVALSGLGFSSEQIAKAFGVYVGTIQRAIHDKSTVAKIAAASTNYISKESVKPLVEALDSVVESAVHPDVAIRSVMVPLEPIRKALTHAAALGL